MERLRFIDYTDAVTAALAAGTAFAVTKDFGEECPQWFCDDNSNSTTGNAIFFASPWLGKWADRHIIRQVLSPEHCAQLNPKTVDWEGACKPVEISTDRSEYLASVSQLIDTLQQTGGKTVISQVIAEHGTLDIAASALPFLDNAPVCSFRCLMYTPQTGCWLIASPEVLSTYDADTQRLHTMSLAGTRPLDTRQPWDAKNCAEQQMVTDFICSTLRQYDIKIEAGQCFTARANGVEHLCTPITGYGVDADIFPNIVDSLCPTPALCGQPREVSIERIAQIEKHPRRLYGGYVGITRGTRTVAAVTLRCAQLSHKGWCIYAGGGITADSVAADEWNEGQMKAAPIRCLTQKTPEFSL